MLGENIRSLRVGKKLTLRKLADISGVNYSYINALETGLKRNPSLDVLNRLAKALEVDIKDLLKKNS